jgi:hypothetical protein
MKYLAGCLGMWILLASTFGAGTARATPLQVVFDNATSTSGNARPGHAATKSRLLTARLITVVPQLRSAAFRGDDEATGLISNVKRWSQSLIGADGVLEVRRQAESGVNTAVPAANDGRFPVEAVGAVVAEMMKAFA